MWTHLVAKDLEVDTADLHVMVDLLMELFQLYVDTNLVDNEYLNKTVEKKFEHFIFMYDQKDINEAITHLASDRINLGQSSIINSLASEEKKNRFSIGWN
jgi:hypothetical protein